MNGREIEPGIWHWEEDYRVYCTLVQGERLAILWDTGQGKQDLSAWVAAQVSTPFIVCNSHGHSDHIGGNFRFPLVYAHPADWPLLAACYTLLFAWAEGRPRRQTFAFLSAV